MNNIFCSIFGSSGLEDMAKAQAQAVHASNLAGNAGALQGQAQGINDLVPQYISAGYQAAWYDRV